MKVRSSPLFLISAFCFLLSAFHSSAQQTLGPINSSGSVPIAFAGQGVTNGSCPGPNIASNVAWFCTSAKGLGAPQVTWLTFSSDIAANNLQVYACTNVGTITNTSPTATNQLFLDATGFASNDVIVLRSVASDTYQRLLITNWTQGLIKVWPLTAFATTNQNDGVAPDLVYKMTPLYTLNSLAAGTTNYNGYGFITGREGVPLLLDIGYSNTASIKAVAGQYIWNR